MTKQVLQFSDFQKPVSLGEARRTSWAGGIGAPSQRMAVVAGAIIFVGFVVALAAAVITGESEGTVLSTLLTLVCVFLGVLVLAVSGLMRTAARAVRLQRFAAQNKFNFTIRAKAEDYPGLVFGIGREREFTAVVSGTFQGLPFSFGNFYCVEGSGRAARQRAFGVIEIRLTRKLPHILLDARSNDSLGFSNLPRFRRSQKLQLEGNFNDYFTLYVPDGYERDALYVITPELMALLIDHGANFDIEIVEDRLYLYQYGEFSLEKQKRVQEIFQLITVLGGELHENTKRYADATVGNRQVNIVAPSGRRLKRVGSWVAIIIVILYLLAVFDIVG